MVSPENANNKHTEHENFLNKFRKYSDDFLLFLEETKFYQNADSICKKAFMEILKERGLAIEHRSKEM